MRCDTIREALSARIDGEDPGLGDQVLDDHLAGCSACAGWADDLSTLHRMVRVREAEPVPDLSAAILAGTPAPPRPSRLGERISGARWALFVVALTQLVLAAPAVLLGQDPGTTVHAARELGAFDVALAIGLLVAAWQPARAWGLLPVVTALALVLGGTAVLDVVRGTTAGLSEVHHLLDLAGVAFLWLVARDVRAPCPAVRRRGPSPPREVGRNGADGRGWTWCRWDGGTAHMVASPSARLLRAALGAAAGGLLLVVLGASPAAAHASLVSVDPPDGARLDESPATVTLTFSETVSTGLGGVQVIDADGDQVQTGAARAQGAEVQVDVEPDLPDGTYVISYRVISADGHPVRGGSVFGVGEADVDTGALGRVTAGGSDRTWEVVGAWGRGFAYAGTLVAAGGTAFLVLVHRGGDDRRTLRRVVRIAAVVGALGVLAALPVQAALGTGQGPGGALRRRRAGRGHRRRRRAWAWCSPSLGLVVAVAFVERLPWLALAGAALAAGSFATNGHTRGGTDVGAGHRPPTSCTCWWRRPGPAGSCCC